MIDLLLDDEQQAMFEVAQDTAAGLANRAADAVSAAEWATLAEIGLFSAGLSEDDGGVGAGARGEVVVAEAFGAAVAPLGVVAAMAAGRLLADVGDERLSAVLDGSARVGLAQRTPDGERWNLVDADGAELLLVLAPGESGELTLVPTSLVQGVERVAALGEGATLATCAPIELAEAVALGPRRHLDLLLAATAVGVARSALEWAVEYAQERKQFGKPIGTFQAIKHRCVDMVVRVEAASSSVRFAAVRADVGVWDEMVPVAVLNASEAARQNPADAIQIFGGIGFTVEGGLHRLLHRGWLLERLMGPANAVADALVASAEAEVTA